MPSVDSDDFRKTKSSFINTILLNRPLQIIILISFGAILLPSLVFVVFFSRELAVVGDGLNSGDNIGRCGHLKKYHVPCGNKNFSANQCRDVGCCYTADNGCYHYYPSRYQYTMSFTTEIARPIRKYSPFGDELEDIHLNVIVKSENVLQMQFYTTYYNFKNYKLPSKVNSTAYVLSFEENMLKFQISNKETEKVLLTSGRGPLIVSESYFEITFYLGTSILLGLNEMFLEKRPYKKLFFINEVQNYVPFIIAYNSADKLFSGITFDSIGPVEIEITESSLIIIRTLSGHYFSFNFLMGGPNLSDVLNQLKYVNSNQGAVEVPYWSLGFHVCRHVPGADISESVDELMKFFTISETENIPFDSHCIQDNLLLFEHNTWLNNKLLEAVNLLKQKSKKFLFSSFSQILIDSDSFERAEQYDLLLKDNSGVHYESIVDGHLISYINWLKLNNSSLLDNWIESCLPPISFLSLVDGFTLKNNCWRDDVNNNIDIQNSTVYPYIPDDLIEMAHGLIPIYFDSILSSVNSVPEKYVQEILKHIRNNISTKLVSLFWTISNYNLNLKYNNVGVVRQNVYATWEELQNTAEIMLAESISGVVLGGTPVCGDLQEILLDEELCIRWYQLASMSPIFRVDSHKTPDKFSKSALNSIKLIIQRRYSLLAYFNTVLLLNEEFVQTLFHHYPELILNFTTAAVEQYFIGRALLVAPVLKPSITQKSIYMPQNGYELWGGEFLYKGWNDMFVVQKDIPVFIIVDKVIPMHNIDHADLLTATEFRKSSLVLYIALNCTAEMCTAYGHFSMTPSYYWIFMVESNVVSLHFSINPDKEVMCHESEVTSTISHFRIYKHQNNATTVYTKHVNFNLCNEQNIKSVYMFEI